MWYNERLGNLRRALTYVAPGIFVNRQLHQIFIQIIVQHYPLTISRNYVILLSESEASTMKIIGRQRVGISLTGIWYCDLCDKAYHTTTLANVTQKNKKICDKCLDKLLKM